MRYKIRTVGIGKEAISLFKKSWGKDFVEGGCGVVIPLCQYR